MAQTKYCFILKGSVPNPKVHLTKTGTVHYTDGSTRELDYLPACGTRVDTTCLEIEWASQIPTWAGDPCGKCFPKSND